MQGTRSNNYTSPRSKPANINVDNLGVEVIEKVGRLYNRFVLTDDFKNWNPIPLKIIPYEEKDAVVIPLVDINMSNMSNVINSINKRQLLLNHESTDGTSANDRKVIPVVRPTNPDTGLPRKAYLNAVSYAAYDYNDLLPIHNQDWLRQTFSDTNPITDAFGSGVNGLLVGHNIPGNGNIMLFDNDTTTADYPYDMDNMSHHQAPLHRYRPRQLRTMELLSQSAPRAAVRHGMLPSDWARNHFDIKIGGSNGASYTGGALTPAINIWSLSGGSYNNGYSDSIFPAVNNEINIEIDDAINWLSVDVQGVCWITAIKQASDAVGLWEGSEKGIFSTQPGTEGPLFTLVQMPLKVQIEIRYE